MESGRELEEYVDNLAEIDLDKMYVECVCPKCGKKHKMNLPWTGRGTPRKFCNACKTGSRL